MKLLRKLPSKDTAHDTQTKGNPKESRESNTKKNYRGEERDHDTQHSIVEYSVYHIHSLLYFPKIVK